MEQGKFITFEGGDGVGKTTQIERLAARLRAKGIEYVVTREPGGTPFAERVRDFILSGGLPEHPALAEALLFGAARLDHVQRFIQPALDAGQWVLCDRFADSTRAYQGAAGGVDPAVLLQLEALTHPDCAPDLTLILDLDPTAGRVRITERRVRGDEADDPFEGRDLDFQERLREAFLEIARSDQRRCRIIDAAKPEESVEAAIWNCVADRFDLEAA